MLVYQRVSTIKPSFTVSFPIKIVIFHSYVSLQEGMFYALGINNVRIEWLPTFFMMFILFSLDLTNMSWEYVHILCGFRTSKSK